MVGDCVSQGLRNNVRRVLAHLGLSSQEQEETVMVLLDDEAPSPYPALAERGFTFADGAGTQRIFREVEQRLGRDGRIDRENRDMVMLPLREVGILGIGTADTKNGHVVRDYWKPKSPNCLYLIDEEFKELVHTPEAAFNEALDEWVQNTDERRDRMVAAETTARMEAEGGRLVPLSLERYCWVALGAYEAVYIDDEDARDNNDWSHNIEKYDLPLNLGSRWPDIVLRNSETGHFWIVDAVESDGEIDAIRKREIEDGFSERGHIIDGYTTTYRTLKRFRERQRQHDNIAPGTYVWIAEVGGSHWLKQALGTS